MKIKNFFEDNFNLKTALIILTVITLVIFIILFAVEKTNIDDNIEKSKERELFYSNLVRNEAASDLENMLNDLVFIENVYEEDLYNLDLQLKKVKMDWLHIGKIRSDYDQIRYIDENGDEIIRVNNRNGVQYVVDEDQLQNKADRYYFVETAKLHDKQIYLTRIDLNVENGEIEDPFIPMIRFSTPLYDDGVFKGIIIINYNCSKLLEKIETIGNSYSSDFSIINENGYYLTNKDDEKLWGFMFDSMKDVTFSRDYEYEWNQIFKDVPQFVSDNGIFTNMTLQVENNKLLDYEIVSETEFSLISHIAYDSTFLASDDYFSIIKLTLKKNLYYLIIIAFIALAIAVYYIKRNENFRKVKFFSEKDVLTNVYNRRIGVESLKDKIDYCKKYKKNFSLCFIDINGLKQVNDILGHVAGDELIKTSSKMMLDTVRNTDTVARMGGDEFIIIFDTIGEERAEEIWKRIVDKTNKINENENRDYIISMSHGIVDYNMHSFLSSDELIKLADERMYSEKEIIKRDFKSVR